MNTLSELAEEYKKAFNITPEQWTHRTRDSEVMFAKREFAKQARTLGFTWREIAKACGNKNHATIIKMLQGRGWREKNILAAKGEKNDTNKRRI